MHKEKTGEISRKRCIFCVSILQFSSCCGILTIIEAYPIFTYECSIYEKGE